MNPSLINYKLKTLFLEGDPANLGIKFNESAFQVVREEKVKSHLVLLKVYGCVHIVPVFLDVVTSDVRVLQRDHSRELDAEKH